MIDYIALLFMDLSIYKYLIMMTNGLGLVAYPIRSSVCCT